MYPLGLWSMTANPHIFLQTAHQHVFTNLSLVSYTTVCLYQYLKKIAWTLPNCHSIRCKISCAALRFIVCAHKFSLAEQNFEEKPPFKRIIARYAMKFHANFWANFRWKITGTKDEIRAFHLHYFCTILYTKLQFSFHCTGQP